MTKKNILVIAAHPDDEVLGMGGTIAKLVREGHNVFLVVLSDGGFARDHSSVQMKQEALRLSCECLKIKNLMQFSFRDNHFDSYPVSDIVQKIEESVKTICPNIVYTHSPFDLNQDHRVTFEASMIACRPLPSSPIEQILTYEVPSSTDFGQAHSVPAFKPTVFEILSKEDILKKKQALDFYREELREFPHPRSWENIQSLMTVRGCSVGAPAAEAFVLERFIRK